MVSSCFIFESVPANSFTALISSTGQFDCFQKSLQSNPVEKCRASPPSMITQRTSSLLSISLKISRHSCQKTAVITLDGKILRETVRTDVSVLSDNRSVLSAGNAMSLRLMI